MPKFNVNQLRKKSAGYSDYQVKSALMHQSRLQRKNSTKRYDIFLSHNFKDAAVIYGLAQTLEEAGFSVFVDWIEAPEMDRENVTPATAAYLRDSMKRSDSLVYAVSENSDGSRWMPWELGYSDGLHGHVAVLPISEFETASDSYQGKEYLGLYPYITSESLQTGALRFIVRKSYNNTEELKSWLQYKQAAY